MVRRDFVLASMSAAGYPAFTPVQVQKFFFLLDENISRSVGGPFFDFEPEAYGPFDKEVYHELDTLNRSGLVDIIEGSWDRSRIYKASAQGMSQGSIILNGFPGNVKAYVEALVAWILPLSLTQLLSSIYHQYPEMRANAVFQAKR